MSATIENESAVKVPVAGSKWKVINRRVINECTHLQEVWGQKPELSTGRLTQCHMLKRYSKMKRIWNPGDHVLEGCLLQNSSVERCRHDIKSQARPRIDLNLGQNNIKVKSVSHQGPMKYHRILGESFLKQNIWRSIWEEIFHPNWELFSKKAAEMVLMFLFGKWCAV